MDVVKEDFITSMGSVVGAIEEDARDRVRWRLTMANKFAIGCHLVPIN